MPESAPDSPRHKTGDAGAVQRVPLRGEHLAKLHAALLDAFDLNSLEHMAQIQLDCDLSTVVPLHGHNLNDIVLAFVRWAARHEAVGVQGLLRAARADNPGNHLLAALGEEWAYIVFDTRPACPYPGMQPFAGSQSHQFYGRSVEIKDAVLRLRMHPFLIVIGPSGSGKSSLAFAGIAPAMQQTRWFGAQPLEICSLRPGAAPLAALAAALRCEETPGADGLESLIAAARRLAASAPLLLIVDQFEEAFTLALPDEAFQFQEALRQLTGLPGLNLLLTARADFYPSLMNSPLWPAIQAHRLEITTLGEMALREAIINPARDVGVTLEGGLVERLIADAAGEPGALPFLQETLVLLWEQVTGGLLPLSAYAALAAGGGGQTGLQVAMSLRADAALAEPALPAKGEQIARRIFLRLVQFGEGAPNTRRQQSEADLCAAGDDPATFAVVLARLVERRLLIASGGEGGQAQRRIDIAHEALISGWPLLHTWVEERRQAEIERRRLEGKTAEWVRLGRADAALLDRVELKEANSYLTGPDGASLGASVDLLALVGASHKALDPGWNRRGVLALAGGALAVIALLAAGLFYAQVNLLGIAVRQALLLFVSVLAVVLLLVLWLLRRADPRFLKRWSHAATTDRLWQGGLGVAGVFAFFAWSAIGLWALPTEQKCGAAGFSRGSGVDQLAIVAENTDAAHAALFARVLERVASPEAEAQAVTTAVALDCASFLAHIVVLGTLSSPDGSQSFYADEIDPNSSERRRFLIGYPINEGCRNLIFLAADIARHYSYLSADLDMALLTASNPPCSAAAANDQGLVFLAQDPLRARRFFLEALTIDFFYVDAIVNSGVTHSKTGDWQTAIDQFRLAQELLPQPSWLVHHYLGDACYDIQDMACAEDAYSKSLELAASNSTETRLTLLNNLFHVHRQTEAWQQAQAVLQQYRATLATLTEPAQRYAIIDARNQAILAYSQQQWDEASRYLAEADRLQSFGVSDWWEIANAWLAGRDEYTERQRQYRRWDEEIVYYMALTAEQRGDTERACAIWQRYQDTPSTGIRGEALRREDSAARIHSLSCTVQP